MRPVRLYANPVPNCLTFPWPVQHPKLKVHASLNHGEKKKKNKKANINIAATVAHGYSVTRQHQ
jgi:hypothetical protein